MSNIPGTNVPAITYGPTGFVAPSGPDVLAGTQADINAAFGRTLAYTLTNPQGQIASSWAAATVNSNGLFVYYTNQVNPNYASGRMQDGLGEIYFLTRIPALPTALQIACGGGVDVPIPAGAVISDASGNQYVATVGGTIPATGSITLEFDCTVVGQIPVPSANQVSIYQAIPGWDTVSVVSGVAGRNTESQSAFEERRKSTVAGNSFGAAGSIAGAVAKVPGVVDFFPYDNATSGPVTVNGVTIDANSIYVCVAGGTDLDVAQAILSKKPPGCAYTGNTTVTAYDSNPLYSAPVAYTVKFQRPSTLQVLFAVTLINGPLVPADAVTQVQNAIINASNGEDNGPRARINSTILAARYVTPIQALGAWAQVSTIFVGSNNSSSWAGTAAIAGTALTVSATSSGSLAIGQTISDALGGVIAGTKIVSGSGSSWVVSNSQTVTSRAMKTAVPTGTQVQVRADQLPDVEANLITVTLA